MKISAAVFLFAWAFTPTLASSSSPSSCCLCEDDCGEVPEENAATVTVSPFGRPEGTTCAELALDLLDDVLGESDLCRAVLQEYRSGCCTKMEEEKESFLQAARHLWWSSGSSSWSGSRTNASSRSNRPVASSWSGSVSGGGGGGSSSTRTRSNNNSGRYGSGGGSVASSASSSGGGRAEPCTYQPVGVKFPTKGGNFGFSICKDGNPPQGIAGASVMDPSQGRRFSGSCRELNQQALNGEMSNNLCGIARIRLDGVCCSNPEHTASTLRGSWSAHAGGGY